MVLSYINMNPPQNTCVPHLKTWHISCFTSKERLESSETYAKSYGVFFSWNHLGIPKGGLLSSVSLGRNYTALVLAISEPILLSFVFCITKLLTLWSFTFFLWSFEVRPCPGVEAGFLHLHSLLITLFLTFQLLSGDNCFLNSDLDWKAQGQSFTDSIWLSYPASAAQKGIGQITSNT